MKVNAIGGACALIFAAALAFAGASGPVVWSWDAGTDLRVYPGSFTRALDGRRIEVTALQGETVHLQIGVRSAGDVLVVAERPVFEDDAGRTQPIPCAVRVPRLILVDEDGLFTPDALVPSDSLRLEANVSRSFWFTFAVPKQMEAGSYRGRIVIRFVDVRSDTYSVALRILPFALPDPAENAFHLNIWQDPAAIARWHNVELWSEAHWTLIERYAENLAAHGVKSATTTIIEGPWDGQTGHRFPTMVVWNYPGEWRLERSDRFQFDFGIFDRYVETLEKAGVREAIHAYSIVYGPGSRNDCQITYVDTQRRTKRVRSTTVGDPWYISAWRAFLPRFVEHLRQKGWLEKTYIGLDEKPDEVLQVILPLVRQAAPGLKLALAGYGGRFVDEVEDFSISYAHMLEPQGGQPVDPGRRRTEGKRTTFYVAVGPIRPNTFLFSPLFESRMLPWIAHTLDYDGILRWAYNSWPDGMWEQPFYRWHSGDMFLVYPGEGGPWDSMRWEMLYQGVQDVSALRLARQLLAEARSAGTPPERLALLEAKLDRASQLATRQYLDGSPWRPEPHAARRMVNEVLSELAELCEGR
jgi:hypothetical protein